MKRSNPLAIVVASILFFATIGLPTLARAVTFTGSASGRWSGVDSSDSSDIFNISNGDIGGLSTFNWGTTHCDACTSFNNRFTFDGTGSDGDPAWNADNDEAFLIGWFTYRNGSVLNAEGVDGVTLSVDLAVTSPLSSNESYAFDFDIVNTFNDSGNPVIDGDIVRVDADLSPAFFTYGGVNYTLQLLGFSQNGGITITDDFSSPEGGNASAGLYGKITAAAIPEPASMLLLAPGLFGLAALRRKFQ